MFHPNPKARFSNFVCVLALGCAKLALEIGLIVDNSLGAVRQLEALIPIIPFYGDENDRQLYEILPYLKELSEVEDLVKHNKEMFEWELFAKAEKYEHFFKAVR